MLRKDSIASRAFELSSYKYPAEYGVHPGNMLRLQQCADIDFLANSAVRASTVNLSRRMNERRQRKSALCASFRVPDAEAIQVATGRQITCCRTA